MQKYKILYYQEEGQSYTYHLQGPVTNIILEGRHVIGFAYGYTDAWLHHMQTDAGEEEKDADKEETIMPETPRLLITGKKSATDRWRSASVSLDGLLDYDEEVE